MTEPSTQSDDEQRRIVALLRSFDVPAPQSLHREVESLVAAHRERHAARRVLSPVRLATVGAVLAAVVAVAIAVGLSGRGGAPTVSFSQAAAPTLLAATLPAPPQSPSHYAQLAVSGDGLPFPYWSERFGWRSTGSRTDHVDGRSITTVFYADARGRRLGYAILAGNPVPSVGGGVILRRAGVSYRLLTENGAAVVTWLRDGRLCVLSGHGVSNATLLRLASWSGPHGAEA